jgi:hypothetical protein
MSVNRVAGHPDYSSAGTTGYIPEIWSPKLQKKFYSKCFLPAITNTDYEGEIKNQGDKVYIRTVPDITTFDYQKGMTLPKQRPESAYITMEIDKGKGFNILLDDVDKIQSDIDLLNKWSGDAAQQVKIGVETVVLGAVYADASAYNCGATAGKVSSGYNLGVSGSPVQVTKSNVIDYIVDCGSALTETDCPEEGRWMIMPAWMAGMILKSDIKDASMMGDPKSVLRRPELIGNVSGFDIYKSNLVGSVAAGTETSGYKSYYCLFGTKDGISFAAQLNKNESLRSTESFDTIVRGLFVYGYKVTKPECLGYLYARK